MEIERQSGSIQKHDRVNGLAIAFSSGDAARFMSQSERAWLTLSPFRFELRELIYSCKRSIEMRDRLPRIADGGETRPIIRVRQRTTTRSLQILRQHQPLIRLGEIQLILV